MMPWLFMPGNLRRSEAEMRRSPVLLFALGWAAASPPALIGWQKSDEFEKVQATEPGSVMIP
jgi:hypothetical protein